MASPKRSATLTNGAPQKKMGRARNAPTNKPKLVDSPRPNDQGLSRFVHRLETLEIERRDITSNFAAVLLEAEAAGFNKSALRKIIKQRLETDEQKLARVAVEESIDDYRIKLGMLDDTPLGRAAVAGAYGAAQDAGEAAEVD